MFVIATAFLRNKRGIQRLLRVLDRTNHLISRDTVAKLHASPEHNARKTHRPFIPLSRLPSPLSSRSLSLALGVLFIDPSNVMKLVLSDNGLANEISRMPLRVFIKMMLPVRSKRSLSTFNRYIFDSFIDRPDLHNTLVTPIYINSSAREKDKQTPH